MASNYDTIRAANIREYGEGTRHLSFLGRLYTERTHFIYELLQNAEDAGATKVLFDLHQDRLEFWHDGRPFDEQDVRGVCGVGEGTKTEDLTKIGKFGIGFKSVYAYTTAPAIHSGDESFRIEHYVRPYASPARPLPAPWTTLLVFPFNRPEVPTAEANQEIGRFLWKLNVRTLLFLRNIAELRWNIHGGANGFQSRDTRPQGAARRVMLVSQGSQSAERQRESEWLVFERAVALQPGAPTVNRVEIAFRLAIDAKTGKESLVAAPDSRLIVFFPTDKDTRLGFLVQGPYRTTPARDNIPQKDPLNCGLVQETATLLVESLKQLRMMDLLTVSLLEALPIRPGDFPKESMFRPIFDAVRQALREQPLFPAHGGGFVAVQKAKLSRGADLLDLFTPRQLGELLRSNESYQWLTGDITLDRAPDLYRYLLGQPNRSDDDPEATGSLVERLEVRPETVVSHLTTEFLGKPDQTDRWMVKLYLYLANHREQWEALKKKPFLRLQDQRHVMPFRDDKSLNAYLPTADSSTFRTVKREIVERPNVRDFLIALGLREPSVVAEVIERILPKYRQPTANSISVAENSSDVLKILRALGMDSQIERDQVTDAIKKTPFLRALSATGKHRSFKKPDEVYLRNPALQAYFERRRKRHVVLVDGGEHQLEGVLLCCGKARTHVTVILDVIHVLEYLWDAANALIGEGKPETESWVTERLLRLLRGQVVGVAAGMRRSATKRGLLPAPRRAVDRCADYLLKYAEYLHYDEYLAAGFPISTGVIEGACRYLVKDRMDITGARWGLDGAEAVLRLRALKASGDFEAYWAFHEQQEFRRNHLAYYARETIPKLREPRVLRRNPALSVVP